LATPSTLASPEIEPDPDAEVDGGEDDDED
jgi:hypothetical protein